jgi:spermidine synthase
VQQRDRVATAVITAEVDHGFAELVGDPDRPHAWTLLLNGTAQSHVDLDDPTHLEFEYVRRLGHVADLVAPPIVPLRALHLGGGAWTLARYVAATRPASTQQVVELDGRLVDLVASRLPADGTGIEVTVCDARAALATVAPASVDLLVLDVFAGARTPSHLTSVEFVRAAAAVLTTDGVYAANVADGGSLGFARTQVAAAAAVFPEVAVIATPQLLHGRRFGNLVLVGSAAPLPTAELVRRAAGDPFPATVLSGPDIRRFGRGTPVPGDRSTTPSPVPPPGFFGRPAE